MKSEDRTKNIYTEMVANAVSETLFRLNREAGIPLEHVLAAAHGHVAVMMAAAVGGEVAHERCLKAAEQVRPLLSVSDVALAAATPHGRG